MKNGNYIIGAGITSILSGALFIDNSDAIVTPVFIILIGIGCVIAGLIINVNKEL